MSTLKPKSIDVALEPKDLPKWETDELKEIGVNSHNYEKYCKLKKRTFDTLLTTAYQEAQANPNKQIKEELRKEIRDALLPTLKEEAMIGAMEQAEALATKKLLPKMREEALQKYADDWSQAFPTDSDKSAFRAQIREVEVDSLLLATTCSLEEVALREGSDKKVRVKKLVSIPLWIGLGPYILWVINQHPPISDPISFALLVIPYLTLLGIATFFNTEVGADQSNRTKLLRECSTEYLKVNAAARSLRHKVQYATRKELVVGVNDLTSDKRRTDERHQPSIEVVELARPRIKARLEEELDPEKLLSDDFDERLTAHSKKA